jgi:hypothetical protein
MIGLLALVWGFVVLNALEALEDGGKTKDTFSSWRGILCYAKVRGQEDTTGFLNREQKTRNIRCMLF